MTGRIWTIQKSALVALVVSCVTLLGAVQPASAQDKMTTVKLALLTVPGIWDAGIFAAMDKGFFADEGLKLELVSPQGPADGLKLLASGGVDFATAHSTEVLTARDKGLPVVSIATNHQFGTAGVMMPADSGVTELKQLEGKTLGITGIPFNKIMLEHMLEKANVDVSKVKTVVVGFTPMPLLLSKRIDGLGDAITWSEPAMYNVQVKKDAADKSTYNYFAFYENGVPRYYTLGVVATEDTLENKPDLARKFLAAWTKGLEWATSNVDEAVATIRKSHPEMNEAEAKANLAEIGRIAHSEMTKKHSIGWQDPAVWAAQEEFMREQGLVENKVDVSKAVTNEYLPSK